MKTSISITGQIMGNARLAQAIQTFDSEIKNTSYNGYQIYFNTKKQAYTALWNAYKYLVKEEPEFKGMIRYNKKQSLSYDASRAEIN